jgi:beta-1,4-mannosyltransferase
MRRESPAIPLTSANGRVASSNRPARILAWPKRIALNPYFATISEGLEHKGWSIKDFTYVRALAGRFDILHLHFPTFPFNNKRLWITAGRLFILSSLMILLRARKRRIAWTVHNLAHHEAYHPELEKRFMVWFTDKLDLTIHLTDSGRAAAFEKFPRLKHRPSVVIPHAHYGEPPPNGVTRTGAAERLGWATNVPILLFFGQIRPYKSVPELIRVFTRLPLMDARLVIAGQVSDSRLKAKITRLASADDRILLRLELIPEDQLRLLLAAATLVVLPYREILNSGAALLSLTHRRPVLIPDRGAMAELQASVGSRWARLFAPPLNPDHLQAALSWAASSRDGGPDLTAFAPSAVVEAHAEAFSELSPQWADPRRELSSTAFLRPATDFHESAEVGKHGGSEGDLRA